MNDQALSVLVIEDNPGDFVLIKEFLLEKFETVKIVHGQSYSAAVSHFKQTGKFDVILLDLILPDLEGEALVHRIRDYSGETPLIILTGYTNLTLARKLISEGASDFLLKDEFSGEVLYKSIIYSLDRKSYLADLRKSKKIYQDLFSLTPQPMWIYDLENLHFLDANQAAVDKYGYSKEELLSMTIRDIRPRKEINAFNEFLTRRVSKTSEGFMGVFVHKLRSGRKISVEIYSNDIEFDEKRARLVLANDITGSQKHLETIHAQNRKLKDIAWTQSHVVRAPLSRILGIINLLEMESFPIKDLPLLLEQLRLAGNEMDSIVQDIVNETQSLELKDMTGE